MMNQIQLIMWPNVSKKLEKKAKIIELLHKKFEIKEKFCKKVLENQKQFFKN